MLRPKLIPYPRLAASLCAMIAIHGLACSAAEIASYESAGPMSSLELALQPGEVIGSRQIVRELIRSGTNEFLFVVPQGVLPQPSSEGAILLSDREMRFFITIRMLGRMAEGTQMREEMSNRIASVYPGSGGLEEFSTAVASHEALGMQFCQKLPGAGERMVRLLWVPSNAGVLEFVLNSGEVGFPSGKVAFEGILLTFRSNEHGRIEVVRFSDKT
jgi:hypothetical protein